MVKSLILALKTREQKAMLESILETTTERKASRLLGVDRSTIQKIKTGKPIYEISSRKVMKGLDILIEKFNKEKTANIKGDGAKRDIPAQDKGKQETIPVEHVKIILDSVLSVANKEFLKGLQDVYKSSVPLLTTLKEAYKETLREENTLLQRFYDYVVVPLSVIGIFYLFLFRLGVITF